MEGERMGPLRASSAAATRILPHRQEPPLLPGARIFPTPAAAEAGSCRRSRSRNRKKKKREKITANSDHSNMITDPVQLERELAQEELNRDLATNKQDELLKWPTISYEEALEREQHYQKRLIKMLFLQRSAHNPSQPPPSQNLLGVKRKAIDGEVAEGSRNPSWQLPPRPPPWQQSQPSTFNQKPLAQPLQRHSQGHQLANSTEAVLRCNFCNVSCGKLENLMAHYQGKKHQAKAMWERTARRGPGGASLVTSSVCKQEAPSTMNYPE